MNELTKIGKTRSEKKYMQNLQNSNFLMIFTGITYFQNSDFLYVLVKEYPYQGFNAKIQDKTWAFFQIQLSEGFPKS